MFKKILIANRGEIACRVIKTARRMGIATVAVYSDADRDALHVRMADEAVRIGPPASAESYLKIDAIIEACRKTKAEAVHPGYGFLSEKADFQEALKKAGIVFIGPDAHAMRAMGDKIESKKLAKKAGVNTVPGHMGVIKSPDEAVKVAQEVGYPVMIKASAGGGGKGMRLARNDEQVREGFVSATNEAKSSFADDRVFIERFIEHPRHIEIQVMADGHGNTLYLGERECSIQRRHQKVIEEAPSPFLDDVTRQSMGEQACALARAVKYKSAGTVEFIVDTNRNFYFLEMNTRLQVEHPVTEFITGLDLVELMIRVAAGEKLPLTQRDVKLTGWAIEARIYAENPFRKFLPSTGRLSRYAPPEDGVHVRVDTGVFEGGEISMFYDPMIAKLITYGGTREAAISYMRQALDEYHIRGVSHNIPFLASLMEKERFMEGDLSTAFIEEEYPNGFSITDLPPKNPETLIAVAATIHQRFAERNAMISGQLPGHEMAVGKDWVVVLDGEYHPVTVRPAEVGYAVVVKGEAVTVKPDWGLGRARFRAYVNDSPVCVQIDYLDVGYRLSHAGAQGVAVVVSPRGAELMKLMPKKAPPDMSKYLLSPMPGLLVSVAVAEGDEIKEGDVLAVVEAMKMENILRAERDARVLKLRAVQGDSLAVDQPIIEFAQ